MRREQLPALLKLLDDPSPNVRAKVRGALKEFGAELPQAVAGCGFPLDEARQKLVDEIVRAVLSRTPAAFGALWEQWRTQSDSALLENALDYLARVQFEWEGDSRADEGQSLGALLDDLAAQFAATGITNEAVDLAKWLFQEHGLRGAHQENYYLPLNGNVPHVIEDGEGLPISLVLIFMLVGQRLGLTIHGCAFPGHFLARSGEDFFDCFNGGRLLEPLELVAIATTQPEITLPAAPAIIIARVLANLANAYQFTGEREKVQRALLYLEALRQVEPAL